MLIKKRTQILATVLALAMTTLSVGAQPLASAKSNAKDNITATYSTLDTSDDISEDIPYFDPNYLQWSILFFANQYRMNHGLY